MAKLSLMFDDRLVKEVPVGGRPIGIGRSPDNELPVDNLAVSNYHARVYFEAGRLVVEDLDSLNGTFVNDLRVERATLHDGDSIWIGKHHIKVDASGDTPAGYDTKPKGAAAPRINETMVLDTKARRDMLQQAAAMGERTQFAVGRLKVPTLGRDRRQNRPERICAHQQAYGYRQIEIGDGEIERLVQAAIGGANQST